MKTPASNPSHWRLDTLLSLDIEDVHRLAVNSVGTLTSYRVVLGRCLLALHQTKGFKQHGCSTAIHYASSVLGMSVREARACRRVARELRNLPDLTLAAEFGEISWSKLREIVRKASPETEAFWLKLAESHNYREIEALVRRTPKGSIPGEVEPEEAGCTKELRCVVSNEVFALLERARRQYSLEKNEAVTTAEVVEWALASYIAGQPADSETLEKLNEEADKDLQAERARELPLVEKARELATEMGVLQSESPTCCDDCHTDIEDLITEALGTADFSKFIDTVKHEIRQKSHTRVISEPWYNSLLRYNPKTRFATKGQKEELSRRDSWNCQTPGCPNKLWLHLHHIKPYSEGGETTRENLLSLCCGCHTNVHDGILKIVQDPQTGRLFFFDQNGRRLDHQVKIERASWLDFWFGWSGEKYDSHQARVELEPSCDGYIHNDSNELLTK